jgi:hypothetical protein
VRTLHSSAEPTEQRRPRYSAADAKARREGGGERRRRHIHGEGLRERSGGWTRELTREPWRRRTREREEGVDWFMGELRKDKDWVI